MPQEQLVNNELFCFQPDQPAVIDPATRTIVAWNKPVADAMGIPYFRKDVDWYEYFRTGGRSILARNRAINEHTFKLVMDARCSSSPYPEIAGCNIGTDEKQDVVSIHVPTHHRDRIGYEFTKIVCACICSQTFRHWRAYITDNADGSMDLDAILSEVESWGYDVDRSRFMSWTSRFRYIHEKRNELIDVTAEPVIANFDDDDYRDPRYLEAVIEGLNSDRNIPGHFTGEHKSYDLIRLRFLAAPARRCGSGHWVYRREWLDRFGVRYSQYRNQRSSSDEMFMQSAESQDATFTRRFSVPVASGLGMRIRHGSNTCKFTHKNDIDDKNMAWLSQNVDARLIPQYRKIHRLIHGQ